MMAALDSGLLCAMSPGEVALWRAAEYLRARPDEPCEIRAEVYLAQAEMLVGFQRCGRELGATALRLVAFGVVVYRVEVPP